MADRRCVVLDDAVCAPAEVPPPALRRFLGWGEGWAYLVAFLLTIVEIMMALIIPLQIVLAVIFQGVSPLPTMARAVGCCPAIGPPMSALSCAALAPPPAL